jgi:hypothetical protein
MKQTNPFCTEAFSKNSNSKKPRKYVALATINLTSSNIKETGIDAFYHEFGTCIPGQDINTPR